MSRNAEPHPGRAQKPVGWSMIVIGVLVAISALQVYRRDGIDDVTAILTNDLALFGGILLAAAMAMAIGRP